MLPQCSQTGQMHDQWSSRRWAKLQSGEGGEGGPAIEHDVLLPTVCHSSASPPLQPDSDDADASLAIIRSS